MNIILAKSAGFCFGVKRAVETVYKEAEKNQTPIYTFGPIIHNEEVVADLEKKGVQGQTKGNRDHKITWCGEKNL